MIYSEVKYMPERSKTYLGSPAIVRLNDGVLVASHDYFYDLWAADLLCLIACGARAGLLRSLVCLHSASSASFLTGVLPSRLVSACSEVALLTSEPGKAKKLEHYWL